jgi:Holliday junction resolvase
MSYLTPEGRIKKQIKAILAEYGVYYFMPAPGFTCKVGVPDYICCLNGHFIAIEAKAGRKLPTLLQQRELDLINAAGGVALVVNADNIHAFPLILQEIMKCNY